MGGMKQFVVFEIFLISMNLLTALGRTISARYLAHPEGEAEILWGSLLLLILFGVGLYLISREARRKGEAVATGTPKVVSGLLLVSSLCYVVSIATSVPKLLAHVSALQVPLPIRLGYALLTAINLGAFLIWTGGNWRNWRKTQAEPITMS